MPGKPFDVASKQLIEDHPLDWLRLLGLPVGAAHVISADLSTVTAESDRVLRVDAAQPYLAQIELQTSWDVTLVDRLLRYNVLPCGKHGLPVESVIVLLRRDADRHGVLTGDCTLPDSEGKQSIAFRYRVLRVWEQAPETFLGAGLGALPLASLADVAKSDIPGVLNRIEGELRAQPDARTAAVLWVVTGVLMELRFDVAFIENVLKESDIMEESTYYQYIVSKGRAEGLVTGRNEGVIAGRAEEARKIIVKMGTVRFGPPDDMVIAVLSATASLDRLEMLAERILSATSWADLLAQ